MLRKNGVTEETRSNAGARVADVILMIEVLRRDGKLPADAAEKAVQAINRFSAVDAAARATANWMAAKRMEVPRELLIMGRMSSPTMFVAAG